MKVIGIIAEYNPFHNGHAYQIRKIKNDLQADFVIVAMSGDFVQRGAPAIIDKYARTQMALSCGADLVIELPVLWATASAEAFAMAGVTLFDKLGCVDGICFGAETDDLETLALLADVLTTEPAYYRTMLSSYLKDGLAFPVARSKALLDYFTQSDVSFTSATVEFDLNHISSILNEPNNILAIEYLKAIKRRNSVMTPHLLKREGAGYHEHNLFPVSELSASTDFFSENTAPVASATAIRQILSNTTCSTSTCNKTLADALINTMPTSAIEILIDYASNHSMVYSQDFSSILGYCLLTSTSNLLSHIGDSTPDIANRIYNNRMSYSSFEQFCDLTKSKDTTYTRISRILLHFILGITNELYIAGKALDYIPYLRILGFQKNASHLLKIIKISADVPLISKLADASSLLTKDTLMLLEKDIFAADLYEQICQNKSGNIPRSEYTRNIVIL